MSDLLFPSFKGIQQGSGLSSAAPIDLNADPIFAMLVNSTWFGLSAATQKACDFRNDVTTYEITGTGYTAGGAALASLTLTASGDNYIFDAADPTWTTSTITARGVILFKRVGADMSTPTDDPLICSLDFGADKTSTAGTFQVIFDAGGIISFQ